MTFSIISFHPFQFDLALDRFGEYSTFNRTRYKHVRSSIFPATIDLADSA